MTLSISTEDPAGRRLSLGDFALFSALVLSWSASWYALALQVGTVPVQTSLFWRFVLAAVIFWGWVGVTKKQVLFPVRAHFAFAGLGFFIFCFNFMMFYYGSQYLFSGLLSVVFSLASVFSLIIGFIVDKKVPRLHVLAGAVLGITGIGLMFWPEIEGQSWTGSAAFGLLLCVTGTVSFCVGSQISAALQRRKIPVISATAWGMTYGAAFSGLFSLALGNSFAIDWSPVYLFSLAWLVLISTVLAFWSYLTLIGRIGAGRAGYATVVFPVFALLISAVVEGYSFPAIAIAGLAFVLAGNFLVLGGGKN